MAVLALMRGLIRLVPSASFHSRKAQPGAVPFPRKASRREKGEYPSLLDALRPQRSRQRDFGTTQHLILSPFRAAVPVEPSSRPVGSLLGPDCTLSRGDLHDPDRWVTQSIAIPPSGERLRLPRAHSLSCISCEGTDGLIRSELSHPLRTLTVSQASTDCARKRGKEERTHPRTQLP